MKKSILIAGSILSLFILISLSYQPIIAEKPIIKSNKEIDTVEEEDCGCESIENRLIRFILCRINIIRWWMLVFLMVGLGEGFWLHDHWEERAFVVIDMFEELRCNEFRSPWWYP